MEGFLHHMAPQLLHPALQSFGCGAFRPIAAAGAFHPLYPKAFARHLGEQYALGQTVGQALRGLRVSNPGIGSAAMGGTGSVGGTRDDTSTPGSATSASPPPAPADLTAPPTDDHHHYQMTSRCGACGGDGSSSTSSGDRKLSCGVCGARLGPGVAQAHFLQELQHLYSLSTPHHHLQPNHHHDEDARWETYQRIRANRQRRLRLRTRKRHHTVESMLGYDPAETAPTPRMYDAEDEPVDVEGDSMGCWPEPPTSHATAHHRHVSDKEPTNESEHIKLQLNYSEDLEISSTNDTVQSPDHNRINTPKSQSQECISAIQGNPAVGLRTAGTPCSVGDISERPADCVSTTEHWPRNDGWQSLAAEAYLQASRQNSSEGENQPTSTADSQN